MTASLTANIAAITKTAKYSLDNHRGSFFLILKEGLKVLQWKKGQNGIVIKLRTKGMLSSFCTVYRIEFSPSCSHQNEFQQGKYKSSALKEISKHIRTPFSVGSRKLDHETVKEEAAIMLWSLTNSPNQHH